MTADDNSAGPGYMGRWDGADNADTSDAFDITGRTTDSMNYPLPPDSGRFVPKFNRYRQYLLPSPSTGRPTSFARATTVSSTIADYYALNQWFIRQKVAAVLKAVGEATDGNTDMQALVGSLIDEIDQGNTAAVNPVIDTIDAACGGNDAAELGQAVHAWLEAVDIGTVRPADVPEQFRPYLAYYRDILRRHGLVAEPAYVERVVLNDSGEETIVGTLDRIYRVVTTGELVLGDLKTSKTLDYGFLEYSVQFAIYAHARLMLSIDGQRWEPMPTLNQKACYCIHIPSDQPERAACVTFDLSFGLKGMHEALTVRDMRRTAKSAVPYVHAVPVPSPEALRYVEARHAIQDISAPGELAGVWEQYSDVWTDDLTQLGNQIAGLFNQEEER